MATQQRSRKQRHILMCLVVMGGCVILAGLIWGLSSNNTSDELSWQALAVSEIFSGIGGIALGWFLVEVQSDEETTSEVATSVAPRTEFGGRKETGPKPKPIAKLFSNRASKVEAKIQAIKNEAVEGARKSAADLVVKAAAEQAAKESAAAEKESDAAKQTARAAADAAETMSGKIAQDPEILDENPSAFTQPISERIEAYGQAAVAWSKSVRESRIKTVLVRAANDARGKTPKEAAASIADVFHEDAEEEARVAKIVQDAVASVANAVAEAAYGSPVKGVENAQS